MKGEYDSIRIPDQKLRYLLTSVLMSLGFEQKDATITADDLVNTDLRGVYSHGVMRFPIMVERVEKKANDTRPDIRVVKEHGGTALIDGGNGMGQVVSHYAMRVAIQKAKASGISGVGVFNSNHNGTEANWAMMALEHDMIGFSGTTGSVNILAPWGGFDRMLGNNPFAFAVPTGDAWDFPVVFDMACSVVARGWIVLAMKQHEALPEGWALDTEGIPTTDAKAGYEGTVLPTGDYKGYGLSLMVGIFSSLLTGAAIGEEVTDFYHHFDKGQNTGHFVGAIDISAFVPVNAFKKRLDGLISFLKSSNRRPGYDQIYIPGELEHIAYSENISKGIPVPSNVLKELKTLAKKYDVDWEV